MPQHRAPKILDIVRLEQRVPPRHPLIARRIEHRHAVPRPVGGLTMRYLARFGVLEGDVTAVAPEPLVAAMLLVREEGCGRGFVEAGSNGEAAGAGADDYYVKGLVVDFFMDCAVDLGCGGRLDAAGHLLFLHLGGVDLI